MTKEQAVIEDFREAVARFAEVLALPKTEVNRDAAIQRFEFTFDLSWKALKTVLEEKHNTRCVSPQPCFKASYLKGLIRFEKKWIAMAKDRNLTVHTYNEELAKEVYSKLPQYLKLFAALRDTLAAPE